MIKLDRKLIISIILVIVVIYIIKRSFITKENFFIPWNIGTRFYPSYDIRGYPSIFPWNYPWPNIPWLYWSPYYYEANGKYNYDENYVKKLKKKQRKLIKEIINS